MGYNFKRLNLAYWFIWFTSKRCSIEKCNNKADVKCITLGGRTMYYCMHCFREFRWREDQFFKDVRHYENCRYDLFFK